MTRFALQKILELFGREQACYTALLDLSRSQKRLLKTSSFAALATLVMRKQLVMERLNQVEKQLQPIKQQWTRVHQQMTDADRQRLDFALCSAEELLAELIASERESETLLAALPAA